MSENRRRGFFDSHCTMVSHKKTRHHVFHRNFKPILKIRSPSDAQ